jgi:serine protease
MRWAAGLSVPGVPDNPNKARVLICLRIWRLQLRSEIAAINDVTAAGAGSRGCAGNNAANASGYSPASCPGVITVAATERAGSKANYSNYGSTVELSAPGGYMSFSDSTGGVFSTLNTGSQGPVGDTYEYYQGTSMAAPHVSRASLLIP